MKVMSDELVAVIKPLELRLKLLWLGTFPAFGIYVFIAARRAERGTESAVTSPQILPIMILLGATVLVQSFGYRWFTLSPRAIERIINGKQPVLLKLFANPDSPKAKAALNQAVLDKLEDDEARLYAYSECLFSVLLVQWGMVSTCALFGMILPPVHLQPLAAAAAGVVSAAAMLLHIPNIQSRFRAGLELSDFEKGMNRGESLPRHSPR